MTSRSDRKKAFRIIGQDELPPDPPPEPPPVTLRLLTLMNAYELERCYRAADLGEGLRALDGPQSGTVLALAGPLSEGIARVITNRIAGSRRFPWTGKTFQGWAEDRGSGINRVRLLGERLMCHFETRVDTSMVDGKPCVVLDYDHAENPWPIRQVRDEIREVAPGLWFGPALLRGHTVVYFALHTP